MVCIYCFEISIQEARKLSKKALIGYEILVNVITFLLMGLLSVMYENTVNRLLDYFQFCFLINASDKV